MQARRRRWPSRVITLGLAMALMGCATGEQTLKEFSVSDPRYNHIGFSSDDPSHWNSTDLSLWMDMNGGG
jgi:hypothetical protein